MLEAIALGKHVVTHSWLQSCEQVGYNVDEKSYVLRDEKKEKEIGFNMQASLNRASQHPLLQVIHQLRFKEKQHCIEDMCFMSPFHRFAGP